GLQPMHWPHNLTAAAAGLKEIALPRGFKLSLTTEGERVIDFAIMKKLILSLALLGFVAAAQAGGSDCSGCCEKMKTSVQTKESCSACAKATAAKHSAGKVTALLSPKAKSLA